MSQSLRQTSPLKTVDTACTASSLPALANLSQADAQTLFDQQQLPCYQRTLPHSDYEIDTKASIALWKDSDLITPDALLNKVLVMDGKANHIPTLLHPEQTVRLIGYQNNWRSKQRDLLRFIAPGEWYLGTSHANPTQRFIRHQDLHDKQLSHDLFNLSIDHIRHYIGVCDTSHKAGVVAIDAPRHYANRQSAGHVNPKQHPALLWRLQFPTHISAAEQRAYINNIRTWTLLLQKVSQFANTPLTHHILHHDSLEKVFAYGKNVLALLHTGRWQHQSTLDASYLNVMEAHVHLPLNLGLNLPLNQATLTRYLGEEAWFTIQRLIRDGRNIWRNNRYPDAYNAGSLGYVLHSEQTRMVSLEVAPYWLKPLSDNLVLSPWTSSELLLNFLQILQPNWDTLHWQSCHQQAEIVTYMKQTLLNAWGFGNQQTTPPEILMRMDELISQMRHTHSTYTDFIHHAQPILDDIQKLIEQHTKGNGYFVSPLQILDSTKKNPTNVGFELIGQLFHIDLLKRLKKHE